MPIGLLETRRARRLMAQLLRGTGLRGVRSVIAGIQPDVAVATVKLGVTSADKEIFPDFEAAGGS